MEVIFLLVPKYSVKKCHVQMVDKSSLVTRQFNDCTSQLCYKSKLPKMKQIIVGHVVSANDYLYEISQVESKV